jgi:thiamine kinase-like enzyme
MVNGNKYYLIDWVNCVSGNPAFDIAEVIIMYRYNSIRHEPKSKIDRYVLSLTEKMIEIFINEYHDITNFNMSDIDKWIIPKLTTQLTGSSNESYKLKIADEIRRLLNCC